MTSRTTPRLFQSISGLVVAIGGCVLAVVRPEHAVMGVVVALIGAGLIEPAEVLSLFRMGK